MSFRSALIFLMLVAATTPGGAADRENAKLDLAKLPAASTASVDFARDVQPVLAQHCHRCHGPEKHKAGLRLDLGADALRGGDSGPVIIPGKSAESILIHNIAGLDPEYVMPPEEEDDRLSVEEIAMLRAWIDQGAKWSEADGPTARRVEHWAFKSHERPELPAVSNPAWVRSPVDAFVLARLEREGIAPSPEADRATLMRRLSLDLLGLPPAPDEVARFVADRRPDAYEQLVDRLLASPHFGEQWGRHWLDLARYADSDGYEKDVDRPYAYLFRDWVIEAVNGDLPFDQFTIEQLAGDLLPDATLAQQIATGFHRQTLTNRENGVDPEEFRNKAVVDRVSTTGEVWLGLTVGCAECHTHKFDPITQREFYQLFAFFNNATEKDVPAPQPAETADYQTRLTAWLARLAEVEAPLQAHNANPLERAKRAEWEKSVNVPITHWTVLRPTKVLAATETTQSELKPGKDDSITPAGKGQSAMRFTVETGSVLKGVTGFRLEAFADTGKSVGRSPSGDFVLSEFSVTTRAKGIEPRNVSLASASADFAADGHGADKAIDGDDQTGWRIGKQTNQRHVIVFATKEPLDVPDGTTLSFRLEQLGDGVMNRFRISASTAAVPLQPSTIPDEVVAALPLPPAERKPEDAAAIDRYYFEQVDPAGMALAENVATHQVAKPKAPETTAAILVADTRKSHVHVRGDFLRPGDEVLPGTLSALHPFRPRGEKPDRLDLARWIVDPANPLTARVTVNQVWKDLFGRGLVATTDDFGVRGEKPSHPGLLDWLAIAFRSPAAGPGDQVALGWSRKALIRLIVTSSTYRQASHTRPELVDRDPNNGWLARQNRFRLGAENVRDAYLAASGLLNAALGGPGIRPRLSPATSAGYFSAKAWPESKGTDAYRRGMYIFFKRTAPYPALMTFDAPDSNAACTRRERSNTPLQALTLLNDPVFFECAQELGRRVAHGPGSTDERIRRAFRTCLSRDPDDAEMENLRQLHAGELQLVRSHPDSAVKILGERNTDTGDREEQATLVLLCRILMNLDEFVTRE